MTLLQYSLWQLEQLGFVFVNLSLELASAFTTINVRFQMIDIFWVVQERKQPNFLISQLHEILNTFLNSFTNTLNSNLARAHHTSNRIWKADINILQGSVVTSLRRGGIYSDAVCAH